MSKFPSNVTMGCVESLLYHRRWRIVSTLTIPSFPSYTSSITVMITGPVPFLRCFICRLWRSDCFKQQHDGTFHVRFKEVLLFVTESVVGLTEQRPSVSSISHGSFTSGL